MNDYLINPKLLKEFKEITSSQTFKEPSFHPEKLKKFSSNISTVQVSANATHKKELTDLDQKFKALEKNYHKLLKKQNESQEELKTLKLSKDTLIKEINILQITNEKLMAEKLNAENTLEENKSYVRKIESRLVQGAKNQYLIEINNKLRKEIEENNLKNEEKFLEYEKIKNEISKKNGEIKILHKALDIKIEELHGKYKGDIKSSLLYDVGTIKQEMDEYKEKLQNQLELNSKLNKELDEKNSKIQELNFAKVHLAELLVENENKLHNLEVEKDSFEKHCKEIKEERNMLREYIDKISEDFKEANGILNDENKNLKTKVKELEKSLNSKEDLTKKFTVELDSLKKIHADCTERIKNLERDLKLKLCENFELEKNLKETKKNLQIFEDSTNELEKENKDICKNFEDLKNLHQNLEKENFELTKNNQNLLLSQENVKADLLNQNQVLLNCEIKLKEQIHKNNQDLEKLKEERDNLKKLMNDAIIKCSYLIKEKSELERELNKKSLQVENLKNTNILLHKNFSNKVKNTKEEIGEFEDEKIMKIGESKIEETNMINLIRREKEKNKEFLEEIKKIKSNLNNYYN